MTEFRLCAMAALACAVMFGVASATAAPVVEVGQALPALGSPEASHLPLIETGVTLPGGGRIDVKHAKRYEDWLPPHSPANDPVVADEVRKAAKAIPSWSGSVKVGSKTYQFAMVGETPLGKGAKTTKVPVVIVPLAFEFNNVTLDPSNPINGCSPANAITMVAQSPLFQKVNFESGKINIGVSQFTDLFQRQNFWGYIDKNNPKYHLIYSPAQTPVVGLQVNSSAQALDCGQTGKGAGAFALVDQTSLDAFIQQSLIPQLKKYISPKVIPIFLTYDVGFSIGHSGGFATGYHSSFATKGGVQVYGVTGYYDVGVNEGFGQDVETASHELAEITDDPFVNNATPPWGHVGQVQGCQANLEVGDPLTGANQAYVKMSNGYTYEVTDLANFSWFYDVNPSFAANGYYSMFNYFSGPAQPCH